LVDEQAVEVGDQVGAEAPLAVQLLGRWIGSSGIGEQPPLLCLINAGCR